MQTHRPDTWSLRLEWKGERKRDSFKPRQENKVEGTRPRKAPASEQVLAAGVCWGQRVPFCCGRGSGGNRSGGNAFLKGQGGEKTIGAPVLQVAFFCATATSPRCSGSACSSGCFLGLCLHGAQHTGILVAGPSDAAEHQIINTLSQAHSLFPSQPLLCE